MSVRDVFATPPLRFRRFGGGYRRADVELVLGELRLTLRSLELELASVRERARDLEGDLREARAEIAAFRRQGNEIAQAMTNARSGADEIEQEAQQRARQILSDAEVEAERLQADARDAVAQRREELARLNAARAALLVRMRTALREFESLLDEPEPEGKAEAAVSAERPLEEWHPLGAAAPPEDELWPLEVELEAGPFPDFEAVSAFEHELARLPHVEDVHVNRLDGGRALIDLRLTESAPLLAHLREHLPYAVGLRRELPGRLVVDVDVPSSADAG